MTTGCGRCRRHPGSKKRPWNVEPASADALRPGPPARLAKASLRKMRPAAVRLEVAGCNAWAGWPDLPLARRDTSGCCRRLRGRRLRGLARLTSRTFAQRGLGKTWPASTSHPFLWRRSDDRPLLRPMSCRLWPAAGAGAPEGRASCCGATRCAGGAARGAAVTRGGAARGACGATRGAAMWRAHAGRGRAERGAPVLGCAAGGAPGGFAVAEVAAMPAARTRSAALRMLDCNMIPAPASSFRV